MNKIRWKIVMIGVVISSAIIAPYAITSIKVADVGYNEWNWERQNESAQLSYFQQSRWVFLLAAFTLIGLFVAGGITGALARKRRGQEGGLYL